MKVICAWCEKEGTPSLLAVWPPEDDWRISHGICETHAALYHEDFVSRGKKRFSSRLHDCIATRAYALYEARGHRNGCDLQDWLDAEQEILSRQPAI